MKNALLILCLLSGSISYQLQAQSGAIFQATSTTEAPKPGQAWFDIDLSTMQELLRQAPEEQTAWSDLNSALLISLPHPNGGEQNFYVWKTAIMEPGLAAKYPSIQAYAGVAQDNAQELLKMDMGPNGFHAQILSPEGKSWYIDPKPEAYLVYLKSSLERTRQFSCEVEDHYHDDHAEEGRTVDPSYPIGNQLRLYRLAVATTGEYSQYHGGTKEGALAAIVTTMNRVNGIYEKDASIRMILVENNDKIVFTDPATDPYSGGSSLGLNQTVVDDSIGTTNYDIGHLFDVGGGGVAFLQSVCDDNEKARGYTSLNPPEGDPFDVDYVSHEMGHQFGGNHTFNNCGGSGPQAYEPGSGNTVMAYAGLCNDNNTKLNSDDHFHNANLSEITVFSILQNGNSCATIIDLDNNPPEVTALPPSDLFIPIETPFELEGAATDPDDASGITYCWEQYDLGPSVPLGQPASSSPSFWSLSPTTSPVRIFPELRSILNDNPSNNEVLPTYTREFNFKLTVRDNNPGGGGVSWESYQFDATEEAGPFVVTSQSTPTNWTAGTTQFITWDVANTNLPPVNASEVRIFLATNNFFTELIDLTGPIPNNGEAAVIIPDSLDGDRFRIKVKGENNIFFNINEEPIEIRTASEPGFALASSASSFRICAPDTLDFNVYSSSFLGFADSVDLEFVSPEPFISSSLGNERILPPTAADYQLYLSDMSVTGNYEVMVIASTEDQADTIRINLEVASGAPAAPQLFGPLEIDIDIPLNPEFSWQEIPEAESYTFQLANDADFTDIILEETGLLTTNLALTFLLADNTDYYWRVGTESELCDGGNFSEAQIFKTENIACTVYPAVDLPKPSDNLPFLIATFDVQDDFTIYDLNVINIKGNYTNLGELRLRLSSPNALAVNLLDDGDCEESGEFWIGFDDDASLSVVSCPFDDGTLYRPEQALDIYQLGSSFGAWRLFLFDSGEEGSFDEAELEICTSARLVDINDEPEAGNYQVKVYPNPGLGIATIDSGLDRQGQMLIFNAQGQLVRQYPALGQFAINISDLAAGMYFYRIISADGIDWGLGKYVLR